MKTEIHESNDKKKVKLQCTECKNFYFLAKDLYDKVPEAIPFCSYKCYYEWNVKIK